MAARSMGFSAATGIAARQRPTVRSCWRWRWRFCCCAAANGWAWRAGSAAASGRGAACAAGRGAGRPTPAADYGAAGRGRPMVAHGRAVFLSDFLGDLAAVEAALAARRRPGRARACWCRCWTRPKRSFPLTARTIFESMGGTLRHETLQRGRSARALSGAAGRAQGAAGRSGARCRAGITTATTPASRRSRRCCGFTARWRADLM